MSIDPDQLELHTYPEPILKQKAEAFELPLPDNMQEVGEKMLEIMYDFNGIGLAGPQAGLSKRIIVFDLTETQDDPNILINPEIVTSSKEKATNEEGCLSFPEIHGAVSRNCEVTVKGYNPKGEEVSFEADGLMSAMFQHEIDHLDGITFVDRLGATSKMRVRKQLTNLEEHYGV